jgi:hypothetical protein
MPITPCHSRHAAVLLTLGWLILRSPFECFLDCLASVAFPLEDVPARWTAVMDCCVLITENAQQRRRMRLDDGRKSIRLDTYSGSNGGRRRWCCLFDK